MTKIDITKIDKNLLSDINENTDGWELYEFPYDQATVSNQRFQMVWHPENKRGGIVFVGSGSSGSTSWTDASSPADAMQRYLTQEMQS
jgi:hypothetical protein